MRVLNPSLAILLSVICGSCKTQRPVVDIDDRQPLEETTLKNMDPTSMSTAYLKVSALSFPVDAIPYTRVSLLLKADGKPDQTIANYMLKDQIPVVSGLKYALTVTVYKSGKPIYSNEYCKNSNKFTAKPGSNNYTVPMCLIPEIPILKDDNIVPTTSDEDTMIETPATPGE